MKRKMISMLLVAVLLTTVAVPAFADTYYYNYRCPTCGIKGIWYRCSMVKSHHVWSTCTVNTSCAVATSYYYSMADCSYGCTDAVLSDVIHYHSESHSLCIPDVVYDCRV